MIHNVIHIGVEQLSSVLFLVVINVFVELGLFINFNGNKDKILGVCINPRLTNLF